MSVKSALVIAPALQVFPPSMAVTNEFKLEIQKIL
jgi:hypothetical protein